MVWSVVSSITGSSGRCRRAQAPHPDERQVDISTNQQPDTNARSIGRDGVPSLMTPGPSCASGNSVRDTDEQRSMAVRVRRWLGPDDGFNRKLLAPLVSGAVLNPINSTIVSVALVPIGVAFGEPPAATAWLISALCRWNRRGRRTFRQWWSRWLRRCRCRRR